MIGHEFGVYLSLADDVCLELDAELTQILQGREVVVWQRLRTASCAIDFFEELVELASQTLVSQAVLRPTTDFYNHLVAELDTVGWERLERISPSLVEVGLRAIDRAGREHVLLLKLSPGYPAVSPSCGTSLPRPFELQWARGSTLNTALMQFEAKLEEYQILWRELELFDNSTWVLEPKQPTPKDVFRRVVIAENTSIMVTLDPLHPRSLPECRFIGPDRIVGPLQTKFSTNMGSWSTTSTVLENLITVLDVPFMPKTKALIHDFSIECAVCYAYDLEGHIPDKVCDNRQCGKSFHRACIYEWLKSIPGTRSSLGTLFGECPYCTDAMTVKAAS